MSGALKRLFGPAFIAAAATNLFTPAAATIFTVIRHLHIANVTSGAVTFSMYVGATGGSAAGTELYKSVSIPANSSVDYFFSPGLKMVSTDFLTALDGSGASLVITGMGTQEVV